MRSNIIPRTVYSGITFTTLVVILSAFILFFFVSVKNNENDITERGFRILDQYSTNLNKRIDNYESMAINENKEKKTFFNFSLDSIMGYPEEKDTTKLIKFTKNIKNENAKDLLYNVSTEIMVKDIFSDEVFTDYLLLKDEEILFKTLNLEFDIEKLDTFSTKVLIENNKNKSLFSSKEDNSVNSGEYFKSGYVTDINIAQVKYKLFLYPILPKPKNVPGAKWYIGGLIEKNDFIKAKRSVPTLVIILITLIFIAVIISFPIIKLFTLKAIERIQVRNLYYAGVAFIIGFAILNILYLHLLSTKYLNDSSQETLKLLNDTIRKSFEKEIGEAYKTLISLDTNKKINKSQNNFFGKNWDKNRDLSKYDSLTNTNSNGFYKFFKTAFWMDSSGMQKLQLISWKDPINLIDLSARDYFNEYSRWKLTDSTIGDSRLFNLQSIYSNTSGEALVALSIKSNKGSINYRLKDSIIDGYAKVAAITTPMYSIIETILPKNIEFRIIDDNGDVWFHDNKNKNLKENLFIETKNNWKLISYIKNRNDGPLKLKLYNRKYYAHISPIKFTDLHLITLESKSRNIFQNTRISVALLIYLTLFLIVSLIAILFLGINYSSNKNNHKPLISLGWLLPKARKSKYYKILSVNNIIQIIVLLVLTLFISLYSIEYLSNVIIYGLSVVALNIFLNYYLLKIKGDNYKKSSYSSLIYVLGIILVLFLFLVSILNYKFWVFIGLILFQMLLFILIIRNYKLITRLFKKDYLSTYRTYFVTAIVLVSMSIPSYIYKSLFIESQLNNLMDQQFHIAKNTEHRNLGIDEYFKRNLYTNGEQSFLDDIKTNKKEKGNYSFVYSKTEPLKNVGKIDSSDIENCSGNLTSFYFLLDNIIGQKNVREINLSGVKASDNNWEWILYNSSKKDSSKNMKLRFRFDQKYIEKYEENIKTSYIESEFNNKSPVWIVNNHLLAYIFALVITILVISYILKLLLKRIFLQRKETSVRRYSLNQAIKNIKRTSSNSFFVNILDYEEIKKEIEGNANSKNLYKILDIYTDFNSIKTKKGEIYFYFGLSGNTYKLINELDQITKFQNSHDVSVVILSKYTPSQIIKAIKNKEDIDENLAVISKLKEFFAGYISMYLKNSKTIKYNNDELLKELSVSNYLLGLKGLLENKKQQLNEKKVNNEQVLKIKELAVNYYRYLWNSCTLEEQFILYDLTTDSIANIQNRDELLALIGKGLIKNVNGLELMNKSFASFILDQTNKDKLIYMEIQAKRVGGWVKFRLPLLLIGLSIVVFIFATQQDLVAKLYGVLISVGGIISVASRFNVIFNKGGTTGDK